MWKKQYELHTLSRLYYRLGLDHYSWCEGCECTNRSHILCKYRSTLFDFMFISYGKTMIFYHLISYNFTNILLFLNSSCLNWTLYSLGIFTPIYKWQLQCYCKLSMIFVAQLIISNSSMTCIINMNVPSMLPWGTPVVGVFQSDNLPLQ